MKGATFICIKASTGLSDVSKLSVTFMRLITLLTDKVKIYKFLTVLIAAVWLANGLFCKIFNLVPRHEKIIARILGEPNSEILTKIIGIAEIFMAIWIVSGIKSRLNAIMQIVIIAIMNCIEFIFASDLLLWGKINAVFAFLFIVLIYVNEFKLSKQLST